MKLTFEFIKSLFQKKGEQHDHSPEQDPGNDADIGNLIEDLLAHQQVFLKHGYKLSDMASRINIPVHRISTYLNKEKKISFNDLVNFYRIAYCVSYLNEAEIKKVNLAELAHLCGFNNRNSFTSAFKKFMNSTPSRYIELIKQEKTPRNPKE